MCEPAELVEDAKDLLLEASELLKSQAVERQMIYKKIIASSDIPHDQLDEPVEQYSVKYPSKRDMLEHLHEMIEDLERKEAIRMELIEELMRINANLKSRDELIEILEEYIDMEESSIYRLVENYSEAQEILEDSQREGAIFEVLSRNDPRLKALNALRNHPEGISIIQLSFMLGTTKYQATKIIEELLEMNLAERNRNLLYFDRPEQVDLDFATV